MTTPRSAFDARRGWRAPSAYVASTLYVLWAAAWTLASAVSFYRAMLDQTGGEWSAPLDDVFIHFDYARETARGEPFRWTAGNGYSSGNTSLSYPFVLAAGYLGGYTGEKLMVWAGIVAAVSVFGTMLVARHLFPKGAGAEPSVASFLVPPALVSLGALSWSLWSGMEVAVFLGAWALALMAALGIESMQPDRPGQASLRARSLLLGAAGVLLVTTRPEGATTLAALGVMAAEGVRRRAGMRQALMVLALAGAPAALALALQTWANAAFTGELSANGAIVKLAINHPYMTPSEKLDDYLFNVRYAVFRNVDYHFADSPGFGFILPALAAASLAVKETRRYALLLWAQILLWIAVVALNGQVRWQNERYTMPAVAWLILAAALGAYGLVKQRRAPSFVLLALVCAGAIQIIGVGTRPAGTAAELRFPWGLALFAGLTVATLLQVWAVRAIAVAAALFLFQTHQSDRLRDQKWFFARASRNIRDQHLVAGRWLAEIKPKRILVGDAGALVYASGARGLDIIGLGGFHQLPFARAGVHGLAASLELIERMPAAERPDIMAIYPTWWGVLPTWFAKDVLARFPVEGNVICGGYEDVIYRTDWSLLGSGERPRTIPAGEVVRDAVDIADLVSERAHGYRFPQPAGGFTDMKILPDPSDPRASIFDGGRRIGAGRAESFRLRGLRAGAAAHLVIRSSPEPATRVRVRVAGRDVASFELPETEGWTESVVTVQVTEEPLRVELVNDGPNDFVDHHVWVTQ